MPSNARCWKPQHVVPLIVMLSLSARAMGGSEGQGVCPPVVEYGSAEQAQVADEVAALPGDARIAIWLADYAVLRDQARACQ